MAALTQLLVSISDLAGKPGQVDRITFTHAGSGPQAITDGLFSFIISGAGVGALDVEKAGHHTYHFDLDIADAGADFTVSIAKSMLDVPRMVTLTKQAAEGSGAGKNLMRIAIGKAREFLLVIGVDYHSGASFALEGLGTKRMHDLREAAVLDDSSVITTFNAKSGLRVRWVMGRGAEAVDKTPAFWKSGWSRMTSDGVKPATLNLSAPNYPGAGVNGMPEVYRHVEEIGRLRPGTLEEFSLLSHAFHGGPILYDTDEAPEFKNGGAREQERDPRDRDGRFFKDFTDLNMPQRKDFAAAFSPTPFVRVWGCFATDAFLNLINKARLAKNDTDALNVPVKERTSIFSDGTVFPDNRPGIIQCLRDSVFQANYMFFLANTIQRPVHGGAPGMGALFRFGSKFGFNLFIARENVKAKEKQRDGTFKDVTILGFKPQMEFLEKNLGSVFSADGYLRYDP